MVDAGARRNCRHAVLVPRAGDGGIRHRCRTRRIVETSQVVAECEHLALDWLVSPAGIVPGHALDQHDHRVLEGWRPETVGMGPFCGDQAVMPAQDRAWRDHAMPAQRLDQRDEQCSIRPVQPGLGVGSAQHSDGVRQH
jgi:hypothetical protein